MPRRPSHRPERVGEMIRQAVAAFLTGSARDPRIGFVTVTGVDVSPGCPAGTVRVKGVALVLGWRTTGSQSAAAGVPGMVP